MEMMEGAGPWALELEAWSLKVKGEREEAAREPAESGGGGARSAERESGMGGSGIWGIGDGDRLGLGVLRDWRSGIGDWSEIGDRRSEREGGGRASGLDLVVDS
jgi:hypothetical protein